MQRDSADPLHAHVDWNGVMATVTVTGELDFTTARRLTETLQAVAAARPERLVLDLAGLVFLDAAAARALNQVHQALRAHCPVVFREPRPSVRKTLGSAGSGAGVMRPSA